MRTGAAELVGAAARAGAFDRPWDAIVATSLVGLTDLIALLPRPHRAAPVILYMHENQLAYPFRDAHERDVHFALTNLNAVLAADRVLWNSAWNRDSFLAGLPELLRRAPDGALHDAPERIAAKSAVVWPPVEPPPPTIEGGRVLHNPPRVVWPHRVEHDKGPEGLIESAASCRAEWVILGERFREEPASMAAFRRAHADDIAHDGYIPDRAAYWAALASADWVHSTAHHEFFGIAVAEALLAGCLPWLPQRLSYPEILPPSARGLDPAHPPADVMSLREEIRRHLEPALAPRAVKAIEANVEDAVGRAARHSPALVR